MCDVISYFPSKLVLRISLNSPAFDVRRRSFSVNHNSQPQCSDWDRVSMCPLDYVHLQGWSGFLGKSRGQMSQHRFAALNFWCAVFWRMSSLHFPTGGNCRAWAVQLGLYDYSDSASPHWKGVFFLFNSLQGCIVCLKLHALSVPSKFSLHLPIHQGPGAPLQKRTHLCLWRWKRNPGSGDM